MSKGALLSSALSGEPTEMLSPNISQQTTVAYVNAETGMRGLGGDTGMLH